MLEQERDNNKANEITGLSEPEGQTQWVTPEYDARGNMITMPKPASPASAMKCVYDAWNRMVEARVGKGSILASGLNHAAAKDSPEGEWLLARMLEHAAGLPRPRSEIPAPFVRAKLPPPSP